MRYAAIVRRRKQSPGFFREKGKVMNQVRRKRMNKKYYRREQNRHAIKKIMTTGGNGYEV